MSTTLIWSDIDKLNTQEQELCDLAKTIPSDHIYFEHDGNKKSLFPMRMFMIGLTLISSFTLMGMLILNGPYYVISTNVIIASVAVCMLVLAVLIFRAGNKVNSALKRQGVILNKESLFIIKGSKVCRIDRNFVKGFDMSQVVGNASNPEAGVFGVTVHWEYEGNQYSCPILHIKYESPIIEKLDHWLKTGALPS